MAQSGTGTEGALTVIIGSMLALGFFALAFFAVIGCVCWACVKDTDSNVDKHSTKTSVLP